MSRLAACRRFSVVANAVDLFGVGQLKVWE